MTENSARLAFAGNALLTSDPEVLRELAEELGDEEFSTALAGSATALEVEYVRLFLNPAGAPCPPWQSAWLDDPRLMGEPHLQALEWFRRYGAEPVRSNEPADHAGLLLLFAARMDEGDDRRRFAREHLEWLVPFCERMESVATHPFYRRLAAEVRATVVGELACPA